MTAATNPATPTTNRVVAMAWGAVLFLILFAYFHHLYTDFAQPTWIQKFGQVCSHLLSVPAGMVSIFGTLSGIRVENAVDACFSLILFGYYGVGCWRHRSGDRFHRGS
jgi:cbb3-type cytochrome oxidase subunit 1